MPEEIKITADDIQRFAETYEFNKYIPGRYSWRLIIDLIIEELHTNINLGDRVLTAIRSNEKEIPPIGMKKPTKLRGPLKEFWHLHYPVPGIRSLALNISNENKQKSIPTLEKYKLDETPITPEIIQEIVNDCVHGGIERRKKENTYTGEWIVFAKHEGENYYLTLAYHGEDNAEILNRLETCRSEFSFLSNAQGDREGQRH